VPPNAVEPVESALALNTATRCAHGHSGKFSAPPCDKAVLPYDDQGSVTAPITPGRDLLPASVWNVWTDLSFNGSDDDSSRGDTEINGVYFGFGVDRFVTENMVLGLQLEIEQSDRGSFDELLSVDRTSISAGPYISLLLDERWSVSGLLTVGNVSSDLEVLDLSGSSDQLQTRASLSAIGQYEWSGIIVRPQASLTYTHISDDDIVLTGTIANQAVSVDADIGSGWYGDFTPSVEFSRILDVNSGVLMPFVEVGAIYSFGEGTSAFSPSQSNTSFEEWAGTIELGARFVGRSGFLLEASLAYNSIFVNDIDSVQAGLFASWNF
jgi:outer membrane autotransporter protein